MNVWSYISIAPYTQGQVLLVLARIFIVGVTENASMILIFTQKNEVCTLPNMMLLNLGFGSWMVNGTAMLQTSMWDLVHAVSITQFCAGYILVQAYRYN
jgi:hypothetical protein